MGLEAFGKPFSILTPGGFEPQITSKIAYLVQNLKRVCRGLLVAICHPWISYSSPNIIHTPSLNIWRHLESIWDLETNTSQREITSKVTYIDQNWKSICRSVLKVQRHPWNTYLCSNIINIPSQKIWDHLGQIWDLEIKTSQRSN